jgi:hypothetical protein
MVLESVDAGGRGGPAARRRSKPPRILPPKYSGLSEPGPAPLAKRLVKLPRPEQHVL